MRKEYCKKAHHEDDSELLSWYLLCTQRDAGPKAAQRCAENIGLRQHPALLGRDVPGCSTGKPWPHQSLT